MARSGRIQGSARVRPWRLGVLIDTNSQAEIKNAVGALSGIWGGYYCPLFDRTTPEDELIRLSKIYDIDSLYDASDGKPVVGLAQRNGYEWPSGFFDPLTPIDGAVKHQGLLPTEDLLLTADSRDYVFPIWSEADAAAMVHTMNWGKSSNRDSVLPRCVSVAELSLLSVRMDDLQHVGPLQASRFGITLARREAEAYRGIWVVDPADCASLTAYWNLRASGADMFAISSAVDDVAWNCLKVALRSFCSEVVSGSTSANVLYLYNADIISPATKARLDDWTTERNIRVVEIPAVSAEISTWRTRAVTTTIFSTSFSTNFQASDHGFDLAVPHIPWTNSSRAKSYIGCVAIEVSIGTESNQELNRTGKIPPYRQVSRLMRSMTGRGTICHARVGPSGTAFLLQANEESFWYPFPHSLEIIASLFEGSDHALECIDQSDLGKLQSRTSAILGGHSSTAAQEPGVRSALKQAAAATSGITSKQVHDLIFRDRAAWPGPQVGNRSGKTYSDGRVDLLLATGLLVPFMDVCCNACGVTSQLHPKDLDAEIKCPYCADVFQLASSLHWLKPRWRLKLAGHLPAQKFESAMPVLATLKTLSQLVVGSGGGLCHALGVEMKFADVNAVEMDIVAFISDQGAPAIVGEVKTANKIDKKDIENVDLVISKLREVSVRAIPMFATMKEKFAEDEVDLLRDYCNRSVSRAPLVYESIPMLPMALVGNDVSMPWLDNQHPFQWPLPNYGQGIWGTAIESCRRNLGLSSYNIVQGEERSLFRLDWT